ncbi:MAG: DUF971 domain-containing protein [Gammaproteobacteria bacterium]|nr:DUF971 domain-containing protein [Gammaproteobacteria bacterium]
MSNKKVMPTEIKLHQKSRILEMRFDDGSHFEFTCEFLRVYSPSAEVRGHGPGEEVLQLAKEDVNIEKIEPIGHYAIKPTFSDGHDTGIFSWEELYRLGKHQDELWADYLNRLEQAGHKRKSLH